MQFLLCESNKKKMATPINGRKTSDNEEGSKGKQLDAGALFVLESKGTWLHAGYHLTASIVGPQLLSLPFAFASLGWGAGIILLCIGAAVTFYSYNLMSLVLEHQELKGSRHLRFRDVATEIMGPRWGRFVVGPVQVAVCCGAVISCTLLGGQSLKATIAPPFSGKMFKALCVCYTVIVSTYFSAAISGYWAFGNKAKGTVYSNFVPTGRPAFVPDWFLFMANIFVILQTSTVALVYLQPAFEGLESRSADVEKGRFSLRNVVPRLIVRSLWVVFITLVAAMLPFFGDINAVIGAFGIIPLDFILPMVLYNLTFNPSKRSLVFWANGFIGVIFSVVRVLSCIAATRQIVLDANTYKLFANV